MNEHNLQKRLTLVGLISFISVPIFGPIGLFAPLSIFAGKFLRLLYNENAAANYDSEAKEIENQRKQEKEALLQRKEQELERLRNHERELYFQARASADSYLSRLPSEEYAKVKKVRIYLPGQRKTFLGIPLGKRHNLEYEIVR